MTANTPALLAEGTEVAFAELDVTVARLVRYRRTARASTATVVVIGSGERLASAAEALEGFGEAVGIRTVLISEGDRSQPTVRVTDEAVALLDLAPRFHDNAVAALRLSSLPTAVWWRGAVLDALERVADLADRLVLDVAEPDEVWRRAIAHVDRTALTDLRWTGLTRWRALLAHLCNLPDVCRAARGARHLAIEASDMPSARLFAGWLRSSLGWSGDVAIELRRADGDGASPLESVTMSDGRVEIVLRVGESRSCLGASVRGTAAGDVSRVVPLGDRGLKALISEELRVRARDAAFERALAAALEISHG
jgi:glucose-6-phosphate dehydrogenase assembly protein OpcA